MCDIETGSSFGRWLRVGLLAPVCAGAVVLGLTAGQSRPALRAGFASIASAPAAPASPSRPAFRLGTAAGALGWSTAVGDFNTDGTPDVAIADRLLRPVSGASYQIEFSVSGRQPQTVAFDSIAGALTVSTSDVDHDNDLDIVVSAALSREVVGVWLNDGEGGFKAADARPSGPEIGDTHSIDSADPSAGGSIAALTFRSDAGYARRVVQAPAPSRASPVYVRLIRRHSAAGSPAASSRAPPRTPHLFS